MASNRRVIDWFSDDEDEDWTSESVVRSRDLVQQDIDNKELLIGYEQRSCLIFKGVIKQLFEGNEIILDDNNLIKFDKCNITDLSVGDLVDVEINIGNEVVVKPSNHKIISGLITDFDQQLSQFIFAGNAFIRKTSSTEKLKVGESLKCTIIETNNSGYKWRAYPLTEEWNQSSNVTFFDDIGLTLPENDSDFLCYRFNHLSSDINTIETEIRFNPSNLETYLIPLQLTDILESKRPLQSYCPELHGALDSDNYGKRFHTLLYLEEYQNQKNLKKYNLSEVILEKEGIYFAIQVPSLAEGRPSLILGDRVLLFRDPIRFRHKKVRYIGFVKEIRKDEILVRLNQPFSPEDSDSTFAVEFQLIRTVYRRCHQAIDLMGLKSNSILFSLPVIKPALKDIRHESMHLINTSLNEEQKNAIMGVLRAECRPKPYIIFGPPGTGKTVTIVESILQVFHLIPESRIIVCTSANSAIDLIAEKLLESKRISTEDMVRISAAYRMGTIPESIRTVTRIADKDHNIWIHKRVILTTASQAGVIYSYIEFPSVFSHVFIDESAQGMEPETCIPISMIKEDGVVVLVGDHHQLGPVIMSSKAKQLELSLMERLMTDYEEYHKKNGSFDPKYVVKLVINYRSDPQIMAIPSQLFYDNQLLFEVKTDPNFIKDMGLNSSVNFHGIIGEELQDLSSPSWYNPKEIEVIGHYLDRFYNFGAKPKNIGILTPYQKQVLKIKAFLNEKGLVECRVGTIEELQGLEKSVIIVSMVRSIDDNIKHDLKCNLGFIHSYKRFNCAVSRAKAFLIVIGNPFILSRDDNCWAKFIYNCIENNSYYGCPFRIKSENPLQERLRAKLMGPKP